MERESFEDAETAKIMNENFINIKVDREERPDVDRVYMCVSSSIKNTLHACARYGRSRKPFHRRVKIPFCLPTAQISAFI